MAGNRNSGNPNVVADTLGKQTGPKTIKGKTRSLIAGMAANNICAINSKLIDNIRRCDKCPMGPREVITKGGVRATLEAQCRFYKEGNKKCGLPVKNFIKALDIFYKLDDMQDVEEGVAKYIMESALGDAAQTKPVEIMKRGHSAGYTEMHEQRALKAAEVLHKMKYGVKSQNLNVNVDLSQELIKAYEKRIKEDEKIIEAEIVKQEGGSK